MDYLDFGRALAGGVLIGLSASILLLFSGRIAGVSGILYRSLTDRLDRSWRLFFLAGLFVGGLFLHFLSPGLIRISDSSSTIVLIASGLLVGFGSVFGSGCTSGHGVCGISRMSARSVVATVVFMTFGALVVYLSQHLWRGGL